VKYMAGWRGRLDWRPLWIAGRLLTRLPFPDPGPAEPRELGRAVPWYPLIGLVLGLVIAAATWLLGQRVLNIPPGVAAALVLALWVWCTGGLHLDGLADSADAWVGGLGDRERTLAIMKDPASGPAGVSALALVLIAKFAVLDALLGAGSAWVLIWVPVLARAQLPLLLVSTASARPQGMAVVPARHAPVAASRLAALVAGVVTILALGVIGVLLTAAAVGLLWLVRRALLVRLGGVTGDTAGALVELTETLVLVLLACLLVRPQ
jgi:adenosylcobinamide-GDP ribazoletransferase